MTGCLLTLNSSFDSSFHFREYLCSIIFSQNVDPLLIFTKAELERMLRERNIAIPPKRRGDTVKIHMERLTQVCCKGRMLFSHPYLSSLPVGQRQRSIESTTHATGSIVFIFNLSFSIYTKMLILYKRICILYYHDLSNTSFVARFYSRLVAMGQS